MTKLKTWLSALLAGQLVLAGALLWFGYQNEFSDEVTTLFAAGTNINKVEISDGEASIVIAKVDDQWQIPSQQNLPANTTKAVGIIEDVAGLEFVWPVSTTTSSHTRFEVEDDKYQREVKMYAGDELAAHFYIGTSPGFRKVHVRQADQDDVYAVELNSFDFPTAVDDWLDTKMLTVANTDHIKAPDFAITKKDDLWQLDPDATQGEGQTPQINADKANQLAIAFSNFSVQGLAEAAPEGEPISFEVKAGDTTFGFDFIQQEEDYFVRRDDRDLVFTLSKYDYERIANVNREAIVVAVAEEVDTDKPDSEEIVVEGTEITPESQQ